MRRFSIKDLERFSGRKAHSIRIWEKRYGILTPQRNVVNVRYYTLPDVKKLLDISALVSHGLKISQIAKMNQDCMRENLSSITSEESTLSLIIGKLIVFMYAAEIEEFEMMLDDSIQTHGIDSVIKNIIVPFLDRTGILSYKDSSIETHFVVTVIRKKLITGIEKTNGYSAKLKTTLLFLPKGEHYDLMLLYMTYVIKSSGFNVLYLGTNISKANLEHVLQNKVPDYLFTYVTADQHFNLDSFSIAFPELPFFIATGHGKEVAKSKHDNIHIFSYKDLEWILSNYSW